MKRSFVGLTCLALLVLVFLVFGAVHGTAQIPGPVENARPTPTPIAQQPVERPSEPESPDVDLPDLVVTGIEVVPEIPLKGQTVMIRVTIKNQGLADVEMNPPNNFWSDLYIDPAELPIQLGQNGVYEWGCQAAWVPAGGSHILEMEYVFDQVKTYALYAQVDTDNHVFESNDYNNVGGPVMVEVLADAIVQQTHEEFQLGMASSLDISHPEGVLRLGIFNEPFTEPEVYFPDEQINNPDSPPGLPDCPTCVNQERPVLIGDSGSRLFVAWEDGRNGGVFNRDIFFSRSADDGDSWLATDVQINGDSTETNQIRPALAYDKGYGPLGRLYAVWQDGRNSADQLNQTYDIYFAYSDDYGDTWTEYPLPLNDDGGSANQQNPSIAIGPAGEVYVVWQDERNNNADIYLVRSDNNGANWSPNYFVTDDPDMTQQNQSAPTVAVDNYDPPVGYPRVVVAWEDWRDPLHPEIYAMWSANRGETFGIDVPVTIVPADARTTYRRDPTLAIQTTEETIEYWDEGTQMTQTVTTYVSAIHLAWTEGRGDDTDVYYVYTTHTWAEEAREECPYPYEGEFCFGSPQKVNGFVIDSDYVVPSDAPPAWPVEPSWQGQASIGLVPDGAHVTLCHAGSTEDYSRGVVIAWSDARSFDDWRYEIHTRRIASPGGNPRQFDLCEDYATGHVNGNAKLYALRDDPIKYDTYKPAATGKKNPSVYVNDSDIYVAWDDNREDDPTVTGTGRDRDVFFARTGSLAEGIYISPVLDGKSDAPYWYVLSWRGVTEHLGDILFQTRFGSNRNPPKDGSAGGGWTGWTGNPGSPSAVGCSAGLNCYYDAPGRHIVDPSGSDWFDCEGASCPGPYPYMQYKVILSGPSRRTAVSRVTVFYEGDEFTVFLPLVLRSY